MEDIAFLDAVRAQPAVLARSAATVRAALAPAVDRLRSGRLLVFGMGASTHAATAFAAVLRAAGRPALAASASEVGTPGLADAYLAVSHSGRSRETVEAAAALSGPRRIGLTSHPDRPLGGAVDLVLPLGCDTDSRVSTASWTATVQALGLLAEALGAGPPGGTDWAALPALAAEKLARPVDSSVLSGVSTVDVIGAGPQAGCAAAAALLLREAVHLPAAAYPTREYLHGPVEAAGPGRGALVFHDPDLADRLAGYGTSVVHLPDTGVAGLGGCVLDMLPVQLLAYRLADRAGIPIGLRHMPSDTKL